MGRAPLILGSALCSNEWWEVWMASSFRDKSGQSWYWIESHPGQSSIRTALTGNPSSSTSLMMPTSYRIFTALPSQVIEKRSLKTDNITWGMSTNWWSFLLSVLLPLALQFRSKGTLDIAPCTVLVALTLFRVFLSSLSHKRYRRDMSNKKGTISRY